MFCIIHGENLMFFIVATYLLAMLGWAVFCYLIIKYWLKRKKPKREESADHNFD